LLGDRRRGGCTPLACGAHGQKLAERVLESVVEAWLMGWGMGGVTAVQLLSV
jgi:hypothetical protein